MSPCRGGRCPSRALVLWGGKERGVSGGSGGVTDTSLPPQSHGIRCHGWGPLPHRNGSGCPQGPPCWEGHTGTRGGDTLGPGGTHTYKEPPAGTPAWHPPPAPRELASPLQESAAGRWRSRKGGKRVGGTCWPPRWALWHQGLLRPRGFQGLPSSLRGSRTLQGIQSLLWAKGAPGGHWVQEQLQEEHHGCPWSKRFSMVILLNPRVSPWSHLA